MAGGFAGAEHGGGVGLGGGVVEGEAPVLVVAEVFDAAQRDLLVVIVAFTSPGDQVAEGAAPSDGDFLQVRMGEGGMVVDGPLDQVFQALGRCWHVL